MLIKQKTKVLTAINKLFQEINELHKIRPTENTMILDATNCIGLYAKDEEGIELILPFYYPEEHKPKTKPELKFVAEGKYYVDWLIQILQIMKAEGKETVKLSMGTNDYPILIEGKHLGIILAGRVDDP